MLLIHYRYREHSVSFKHVSALAHTRDQAYRYQFVKAVDIESSRSCVCPHATTLTCTSSTVHTTVFAEPGKQSKTRYFCVNWCNNNNKNNNNTTSIFIVLSSTAQSHVQEFTLMLSGGRQLVGQAANLTFGSACRLL